MVNNRGWLRILEASIAILIVLSVLFVVTKQNNVSSPPTMNENLGILEQMALNSSMRMEVLNYNISLNESDSKNINVLESLKGFVNTKIPVGFEYEIKICNALESCEISTNAKETISEERIFSANASKFEKPVKIILAYWQE